MREKILQIIDENRDNIEALRDHLFAAFNETENKNYNSKNASPEEEEEITRWIVSNEIHFIGFDNTEDVRRVFVNETSKVSFLTQSHCNICQDKLPISNFPVRITPKTRQTKTKLKNEFIKQFLNSPFGKELNFSKKDKLCVKLVFIFNRIRDKDLDNMAKLTLDALKELIQIDDKNIDHLELIKFKARYLESFIYIRISKSDVNTANNVILKGKHMTWAGLTKLDE